MKEIYITRAVLKDYLTIKDVDITLNKDINIIIGQNGTGKTNFINYLNDSLKIRPEFTNNYSSIFFYIDDQELQKTIEKSRFVDDKMNISEVEDVELFRKGRKLDSGYEEIIRLSNTLISHGIPRIYPVADVPITDGIVKIKDGGYMIFPNTKRNPISFKVGYHYLVDMIFEKGIDGKFDFNYPLIELKTNLERFSNISSIRIGENFKVNDSDIKDVQFNNLYLEYLVNGQWLHFNNLSDGTKRLFYIISEISFSENPIILLEEPELGLHPHQLYKLMDFIKESSDKFQFIITTHSPIVLNMLEKDELDSVIIATIEAGATKLSHLTSEQIEKAKAYMDVADLSDYWMHSDLEEA